MPTKNDVSLNDLADAIADIQATMATKMATKDDLNVLKGELRAEFRASVSSLETTMTNEFTDMAESIASLGTMAANEFGHVKARLTNLESGQRRLETAQLVTSGLLETLEDDTRLPRNA